MSRAVSRDRVLEHYGTQPLWDRVEVALRRAGLGDGRIDWSALVALDQFHSRGAIATRQLAQALGVAPGECVLDVGSGLGGPARLLASEHGCDMTGVDLSAEFVDVATRLTERTGLTEHVRFTVGDALDLPFADAGFDHVVTQHVAMNIADRPRLYAELARVLKPEGRLAIHDVVAGDGEPLRLPVPWAGTAEASFLLSAEETRAEVAAAGFAELDYRDETRATTEWFQALAAAPPPAGGALGLPVVMGPGFPEMARNLAENLAEGRVGVIVLVARKPSPGDEARRGG
jgi:sarcosine/dimethylglycine N-methyltransferase